MKKYLVIILFAVSLLASGCGDPNQAYVRGNIRYANVILPEYEKYIKNDPKLLEESKKIRLKTSELWMKLILEGKKLESK